MVSTFLSLRTMLTPRLPPVPKPSWFIISTYCPFEFCPIFRFGASWQMWWTLLRWQFHLVPTEHVVENSAAWSLVSKIHVFSIVLENVLSTAHSTCKVYQLESCKCDVKGLDLKIGEMELDMRISCCWDLRLRSTPWWYSFRRVLEDLYRSVRLDLNLAKKAMEVFSFPTTEFWTRRVSNSVMLVMSASLRMCSFWGKCGRRFIWGVWIECERRSPNWGDRKSIDYG